MFDFPMEINQPKLAWGTQEWPWGYPPLFTEFRADHPETLLACDASTFRSIAIANYIRMDYIWIIDLARL